MDSEILSRSDLTITEIAKILNCSTATVTRRRKALGITVSRGCKPGKPNPSRIKREERSCKRCSTLFTVIPSNTKLYCSLSCSSKSIDKSYMQSEEYRNKMSKDTTPAYKKYAGLVHRLTKKTYEKYKHIINPNDYPRTICGIDNGWQLDHIVSIKEGFEKSIPAEELASLENLRMLPWKQNLMRNYEHSV